MWKVPLFDTAFDEKEAEAIQRVVQSGWLTMGKETERFEDHFAQFVGTKHALAVSSGTAALHLAHSVLDIGHGDEVICPALTFVAGANAVRYTGATPVFAEIGGETDLNLSPSDMEHKITERTKAIQVVHYAGYPADMEAIKLLADSYNLRIIEDCAHALGATWGGKHCGTIGDVGCFSFFSNKNMTTGEGGMITTNDAAVAEKIRFMRSHGMTSVTLDRHNGHAFSYDVVRLGFNYRIDEIRAALGCVQLKKLPSYNQQRQELVETYRNRLSHGCGITIPFHQNDPCSAHHIFPVILNPSYRRIGFMNHLKTYGIQSSIHYPPIHLFTAYRELCPKRKYSLPITEDIAAREVTLPLYPTMTVETADHISDIVLKYLEQGGVEQ